MRRIVLLFGCLAVLSSGPQAGELYRWRDAQGKVHYGDAPPPEAAQVEAVKFPAADAPEEGLPYETRRARQNFPVTLYVADNCGEYCDLARSLLRQRGIPFSEKKLATPEDFAAFRTLSGSDGVPTLAVGKAFLRGFEAGQWHGELDIAGYPKSAPYRPPAPPPAPAAASGVEPAGLAYP